MKYKIFFVILLSCFVLCNTLSFSVERTELTADQAHEYIIALSKQMDQILNFKKNVNRKAAALRTLFQKNFAIKAIGHFLLQPYWSKMTMNQRYEYLKEFNNFVLYKYSTQIACIPLSGNYKVSDAAPVNDTGQFLVNTIIDNKATHDGFSNILGWRIVRLKDGSLKIIDIIVNGLSMVENERASFQNLIQTKGIDVVIQMLHKKNIFFMKKNLSCS